MTEDQIRALCLSDKRERALLGLIDSAIHCNELFWGLIREKNFGAAASIISNQYLYSNSDTQFYADAIWEG